jgi:hypothetical protein
MGEEITTPFIRELTEARLFRYQNEFKNQSVSYLSKMLFLNMLMLEVLRLYDKGFVKKYAGDTYYYGSFDGVRSYASDLHNMIAALVNWDIRRTMSSDNGSSVPVMTIRRYLLELSTGSRSPYQQPQDRNLFAALQTSLKVQSGVFSYVRRALTNLADLKENELADAAERLSREMENMGTFTDIHWHYKQNVRQKALQGLKPWY